MRSSHRLLRSVLLLPALLAACVPSCRPPGAAQVTAELFLGGSVPDAPWQQFLAEEVTPRFPAGLTVLAGDGQWRDPGGRIVQEKSRVLIIVMPHDDAASAALATVAAAYRERFHQQSVGIVTSDVCAAF